MFIYILISFLAGFFAGFNFGYLRGKSLGMKIANSKAPLQFLQKSLKKGYCLICFKKID